MSGNKKGGISRSDITSQSLAVFRDGHETVQKHGKMKCLQQQRNHKKGNAKQDDDQRKRVI